MKSEASVVASRALTVYALRSAWGCMHDDEAMSCVTSTIRLEEFEKLPDAAALAKAILDALEREGLRVVRVGDHA